MLPQKFEDDARLRIKFASIDTFGVLRRDAADEYTEFFSENAPGWSSIEAGVVRSSIEYENKAWVLDAGSLRVVAVAHETGIEFLIATGSAIAGPAILELVKWAWSRWRASREAGIMRGEKTEPTLVIQTVEERFPDGRVRLSRKLELPSPVDPLAVGPAIARVLAEEEKVQNH